MSAAPISDLELDRLLSLAPPPPAPAADLADRIAARALRTPQRSASPFRGPRGRRRTMVWTAVLAANVMTAAAAAAAWNGEAFDFHRLTELPHRVAVAMHIGHHHVTHSVVARRRAAPAPQVASAGGPTLAPSHESSPVERVRVPTAVITKPRTQLRAPLVARPIEPTRAAARRASSGERQTRRPEHHLRMEVPPQPISRMRPIERIEPPVTRSQERVREATRSEELKEPRVAAVSRPQVAPQATASAPAPADLPPPQTKGETVNNRPTELAGRRFPGWRNQFFKRQRPRERGYRSHRRF